MNTGTKGIAEEIQILSLLSSKTLAKQLIQVRQENERITKEMDERESIIKVKLKIKQDAVDEAMTENQQLRGALGYAVPGDIQDDPDIVNGIAESLSQQLEQVKEERDTWKSRAKDAAEAARHCLYTTINESKPDTAATPLG